METKFRDSYQRIKILYVVSTLRQTGPTNQLLGIIKNLNKNYFDVSILTLSPEPTNSMKQYFLNCGIKIESLNLSRFQFYLYGKKKLKKYIKCNIPMIVHTSGIRADVAISKLKMGFAHCMTIRNFAFDDYIAKYGRFIGKLMAQQNIGAMRNCDRVICCSKTLKKMYAEILDRDMDVVQNGINTSKFLPPKNKEEKYEIRKKLNIPNDKCVFLVVGSLIKRKDPLFVIRAFRAANRTGKGLLILLGDGELRKECEQLSNEYILIKGNVSNITDYLKAADVFVSASRSEGLPNAVLEAASCGLNMILSNIPQHKEVFEDFVGCVDNFEIGDYDKLKNILTKYIENTEKNINYKIAKYIHEKFNDFKMSKNYEKIYFEMANLHLGG